VEPLPPERRSTSTVCLLQRARSPARSAQIPRSAGRTRLPRPTQHSPVITRSCGVQLFLLGQLRPGAMAARSPPSNPATQTGIIASPAASEATTVPSLEDASVRTLAYLVLVHWA
jgi:hypothetical protein